MIRSLNIRLQHDGSGQRMICSVVEDELPEHAVEVDQVVRREHTHKLDCNLLYERVQELTNNALRRIINQVEPELKRLRQTNQAKEQK